MKKSRPKRHHFVPIWYLNGFTEGNSGYLNLYDRKTGFWRRQRPKQVMTINHYYRQLWVPKGIDPNILETSFANEVEDPVKKVFEKLLTHSNDISADEGAILLHHIELQHLRVPRYADLARKVVEEALLKRLPSHIVREVLLGNLKLSFKESLRFDAMRVALGSLVPYFSRMYWKVHEAEVPHSFITSDNPITFFNIAIPPPGEPGIGQLGTILIYPIDSTHLLTISHPEFHGDVSEAVKLIEEPELRDKLIEINFGSKTDGDNVQKFNEIILNYSNRYIAGSSKELLESVVGASLPGH